MAIYNFPWTGRTTGKAGPYTDATFARMMRDVFNNYLSPNSGVVPDTGDGVNDSLSVQQTAVASTSVRVRPGSAFVAGRWVMLDDDEVLPVTSNSSGFTRKDLVVMRSNSATQEIEPFIIDGTPSGSPVIPSPVQSGSIFDIPLAVLTVASGFTSIVTGNIDNTVREWFRVAPVELGGTGLDEIAAGQLVAGSAAQTMVQIAAPVDFAQLYGNTGVSGGMAWVADARKAKIRANGGGAIGTSATLVPFASSDVSDPGGLIVALSSNQLRLQTGTYLVEGFIGCTSDTVINAAFWMAVSTATTTALVLSEGKNTTNVASQVNIFRFPPTVLTVTSTATLYEFYGQRQGAATFSHATGVLTGLSVTGLTPYAREVWFTKIR